MHGWGVMGGAGWTSLLWVFVLALALFLFWSFVPGTRGRGDSDTPETILKRRYAHGDISREEYERRLQDLRR